jgi:iron(III) transport system permease protein
MLASPRIGLFNNLLRPFFGPEFVLFNVYSWTGLILITGISSSTLAFLLMAAAVRNIDPHFEEAAMSSGAGTFTILRRVTFPLLKPAMLTVFLLLFVNVIQYFETPFILGWQAGIRVFSAWVYSYTRLTPTDYGAASSLSLLYLAIMAIGVFAYLRVVKSSHKYATVTPKAFRSRQIELGKGKIIAVLFLIVYLLLHTILPFAIVLWAAFTPYFVQPSFKALSLLTLEQFQYAFAEPSLLKAFVNTMIMATSAATVVVILTAIIAWIVIKTNLPGRGLLDGLAFSTTAYPGIVLSLGLFWFYVQFPMGIYGTLLVLTLATITNYTAHGVRFASGTIIQIHKDLEEVAMASGASWFYTFRRIILPLMKGGLFGAWVYVAFSSMRDLSTYLLLYTNESIIMSVIMFDHWYGGAYNGLSATALIMMVSMGGVIVTSRALLGGLHLKERLRE